MPPSLLEMIRAKEEARGAPRATRGCRRDWDGSPGERTRAIAQLKLGEGWGGEEALAIGLFAALVGKDFPDAIRLATNHDGDSDSTASIAGQLVGAVRGCAALPRSWAEPLDVLDPLLKVADEFVDAHLRRT